MATGEQIKALIKAHYAQDNDRFKSAALRIAASETKMDHASLGKDILSMVQQGDHSPAHIINLANKDGLFLVSFPEIQFSNLVVSNDLRTKIQRIINLWGT